MPLPQSRLDQLKQYGSSSPTTKEVPHTVLPEIFVAYGALQQIRVAVEAMSRALEVLCRVATELNKLKEVQSGPVEPEDLFRGEVK